MSLALKKFENSVLGISINTYIDGKQNVWFKGKDVALALGYKDADDALRKHVDGDYKCTLNVPSIHREVQKTTFTSEPGLYALILRSKWDAAKVFQKWFFSEVLPSIRKYGHYRMFNNPKSLAFEIEDEYDLHTKLVQLIRRFYPETLITAGLGENQNKKEKRIRSFKKGYMKGQPDLIIQNLHKRNNGLCIEFKTPQCNGITAEQQKELLEKYEDDGYKCIISNDYDLITKEINDYIHDNRIKCKYCRRKFISRKTLGRHIKYFHRIE